VSFEKALAELEARPDASRVEVECHSYQLHPELPPTGQLDALQPLKSAAPILDL
jgi:hypothetical protein